MKLDVSMIQLETMGEQAKKRRKKTPLIIFLFIFRKVKKNKRK